MKPPVAHEPNPRWGASTLFGVVITLMSTVLASALITILFVSRYLNYGAEGIEIAGLLRESAGLSFMTRLPEIPWYVNQYSPYFYAIFSVPIELLGIESLHAVTLCARSCVLASAFALLFLVYRHFQSRRSFSTASFCFASLWFLLMFPANIAAVRPDFPAFLLEFLGFVAWQRADTAHRHWAFRFALAGVLFGSAIALKLNTLGVVAGLLAYEANERRWLRALVLAATTSASVLFYLASSDRIWGRAVLHDTFLALMNQPEIPTELVARLGMLVLYAAPLCAVAALGLRRLQREQAPQLKPLLFAIAASAAIATLQQAKAGAWYNYYYGCFALLLPLAAVGIDVLFDDARGNRIAIAALLGCAVLHSAWAFRVPFVVARDHEKRRFPYEEARAWFDRELPRGALYSDDPNALLYFHDRVLLGPNSEIILDLTPALRQFAPALLSNMRKTPYVAAVATGPACAEWRPGGAFVSAISQLTHLRAKFGWICVFGPDRPGLEP